MSKIKRQCSFEFPYDVVVTGSSNSKDYARKDVKAFYRRARSAGLRVVASGDNFTVYGQFLSIVRFIENETGDAEMAAELARMIIC